MPFSYRTYSQVNDDVARWLPHVPEVSAVAGVPRSGVIIASMIAQLRNIPMVTIESLMGNSPSYRPSCSRTLYTPSGPILIVDDTCNRGRTKKHVKPLVQHDNVLWGAVYASDSAIKNGIVDIAGYRIATPYHAFEWNLLRDGVTPHILTDMDGVLCPDWHRPIDYGEHLEEYENWLVNVSPMRLPTQPVRGIVTARLEKYRPQTVDWLRRHGVRYEYLIMHEGDDPQKRNSVKHKVKAYRNHAHHSCVFIESCPKQSRVIAEQTGWAVLCFQTHELHNPTRMEPRW